VATHVSRSSARKRNNDESILVVTNIHLYDRNRWMTYRSIFARYVCWSMTRTRKIGVLFCAQKSKLQLTKVCKRLPKAFSPPFLIRKE
jgi:hypothetical protein